MSMRRTRKLVPPRSSAMNVPFSRPSGKWVTKDGSIGTEKIVLNLSVFSMVWSHFYTHFYRQKSEIIKSTGVRVLLYILINVEVLLAIPSVASNLRGVFS